MGLRKILQTSIEYGLISFGSDGRERPEGGSLFSEQIVEKIASEGVTNVFFFCHGWKGDVPEAAAQYDRWIKSLAQLPGMQSGAQVFPGFSPLFIGLHWPSLPFGDEEVGGGGSFGAGGANDPTMLLNRYAERLGDTPEIRRLLGIIIEEARRNAAPDKLPANVIQAYQDLNRVLGLGSAGVSAPPDADREGFDPQATYELNTEAGSDFGGFSLGALLSPLRQLSYWMMKKRARTVGEGGMHAFVTQVQKAAPNVKIHLMGHSFGTIVISGMVVGPGATGTLLRPIDSVVLAQGAVSLWSYAASIPFAGAGAGYYSRSFINGRIKGPLVTTQSKFDRAVGIFYPLASRVQGDASFGGGFPEFGAMGTYGLQGLAEGIGSDSKMLPVGSTYDFKHGRTYNLNSSEFIKNGGGASGAHSDIDGPEVAQAIWQAAVASR